MEQQHNEKVTKQLQDSWSQLFPVILDEFTTVSKSDLDAARTAEDLTRRIADKSRYSERYVESRIVELASTGGRGSSSQQPFSQTGRQ